MSTVEKALRKYIYYPESDGKPMAETDFHINVIVDLKFALRNYYRKQKDVYVSGCIMMYYVEGDPTKSVSPDVFVVKGVAKEPRRTYKIWDEGHAPNVVIEISSRKTKSEDFKSKMELYAQLGVKEYYIFNPEYPKRSKAFRAYRLAADQYVEVLVMNGRVLSKELGLELVDTGETLRLYDPQRKQFLPTEAEEVEARQQAETAQRKTEKALRQEQKARLQEAEARKKAEAELARLREKLRKRK